MKVVHISWLKRAEPGAGGVEVFGQYLHRVLTERGHEVQLVSWSDYPAGDKCASIPNPDKALLLGNHVESSLTFDVAVSDGYWGAGITRHPVVPVVHGTWAQFHVNMGNNHPTSNPEVQAQHAAFNAVNAFPVAVSPAAGRELEHWHRRKPHAVILNAVDLERFSPLKTGNYDAPPLVLHAATNDKKGKAIMPTIQRRLAPAFNVLFLDARSGEEHVAFQRGDIFLHPSRHEGNAYALLEAMAVGLPIVTTPVGLFEDIPDNEVGRILPVESTSGAWADAVREVWGDGLTPYRHFARRARRTAGAVADLGQFGNAWEMVLRQVTGGVA